MNFLIKKSKFSFLNSCSIVSFKKRPISFSLTFPDASYCTAFFSRRINQPIAVLIGQAQKIELGKLQFLPEAGILPEESPRELGEIYRAFQTMARKLIEDIQELDWINAKLMETEERFRVLAESSMVGVYILDENGKAY